MQITIDCCPYNMHLSFGSEISNEGQMLALQLPWRQKHDCCIFWSSLLVADKGRVVQTHMSPTWPCMMVQVLQEIIPLKLRLDCLPGSNVATIYTVEGLVSLDALRFQTNT